MYSHLFADLLLHIVACADTLNRRFDLTTSAVHLDIIGQPSYRIQNHVVVMGPLAATSERADLVVRRMHRLTAARWVERGICLFPIKAW